MKKTGKEFMSKLRYLSLVGVIALGLITIVGSNGGGGDGGVAPTAAQDIAPTVTTSDATSVAASTATLNGSVNPNGLSTTYYFEYGTTTNYGSTTTSTDAGTGTTAISVSADLTGLSEGTTYHFRLVATNSVGTSNGDDKTFTTLTQISIFNQSPTHKSAFTTNSTPVTISGMGNGSISAITWKNVTTGKSGDGTGTESWSVEVPLQEGDNEITITASATAGDGDVTITLTVTYNTSVNFTSLPQLTPDTGIVGQTYDTTYLRIGIDDTNLDTNSVKVFKVDDSGDKVGSALGSLTDDGDLTNGDEIQGDGIFSTKISLTSSEAGPINMRVFASNTSATESKTGEFSFNFFAQPTDEQLTQQSSNNDSAASKFSELISTTMKTLGLSKQAAATKSLDEMVSYLKGLDGVLEAGKGGFGVWWLNEAGMFCVLSSTDFEEEQKLGETVDERGAVVDSVLEGSWSDQYGYDPRSTRVEYLKTGAGLKKLAALADDDKYNIGSTNTIHISPYKQVTTWYSAHAAGTGWFDVVDVSTCPAFNKTTKINDDSDPQTPSSAKAPLDVWKSLSSYGLISSLTHGDSFDIVKEALENKYSFLKWIDWLFPWHDKRVVFHTNIRIDFTSEGLADYLADILAGRLMLFPYGDGKVKLLVTPEFISYYNGTFPNSIWFSMSCRSAYNDTMGAVFLAKGGGAYYGFSDYVLASYAFNTERTVFEKLINEEKNAGEAFDAAVAAHGANDGSEPAAIIFYGEKKTKIGVSELKNPSFEDPDGAGSLNGWIKEGDGRVIKVLGSDSPTDGSTMAIISTGLGFTTTTGTIYQSFCLSDNAKNLIFDWNFYSEEFKEWCGSSYDDTFNVSIVDIETGTETVLFKTSVNILCENTGALIDSPVDFDMGDAWYTGWQSDETVDISTYKGKGIILKFFATDKGDSIYDTAILIDNIRITTE